MPIRGQFTQARIYSNPSGTLDQYLPLRLLATTRQGGEADASSWEIRNAVVLTIWQMKMFSVSAHTEEDIHSGRGDSDVVR